MYPDGLGGIVLVVNVVWLVVLSLVVFKNHFFLRKLFPSKPTDFQSKLELALKQISSLEDFKKQNLACVQRVVLKRYNPYKDTGGDQSFSIALLNGEMDGVVVTSLHSRASTRVFAKPVRNGKEVSLRFSIEEKEVVEQAQSGTINKEYNV